MFQISSEITRYLREQGVQLTVISKECDFCHTTLPTDFKSRKCPVCPTEFDECPKCAEFRKKYGFIVCHNHGLYDFDYSTMKTELLETIDAELSKIVEPKEYRFFCANLADLEHLGLKPNSEEERFDLEIPTEDFQRSVRPSVDPTFVELIQRSKVRISSESYGWIVTLTVPPFVSKNEV